MSEARVRADIVRYCALLWQRGLVRGTSGNVSALVDDADVIVTPAQHCLRDLVPENLVRVNRRGEPRGAGHASTELPLHLAAYEARPDIRAVIHTHPSFCVVWSKTGSLFPRDTVGAQETLGSVAWTPFAPAGSQQLARITADAFANGVDTVVMERHGVSAIASDLERAFVLTDQVEEAARIAYYSALLLPGISSMRG